jgi:anti-sigma regulatory factor (Ser/Thr protein kinase)
MTVLICIHRPLLGLVQWISCGAPDLIVVENGEDLPINPEKKGGLPIGLFADTVYTPDDVVETKLSRESICIAYTDGLFDISRDVSGEERLPQPLSQKIRREIALSARQEGSLMSALPKFVKTLSEFGYEKFLDDVTLVTFGARTWVPGIYEATTRLLPEDVDVAAQDVAEWCRKQGWPEEGISRVQLVLEEKLMNICDHGFNERDRLHEVATLRLKRIMDTAVLTIWDAGTPEPSIAVVAGDSDTAFEMKNRDFSGRGRGRLIVRELCNGIERNSYPPLNETTYHIPFPKEA